VEARDNMPPLGYETGRNTTVDPSEVISRDDFADFFRAVLQDYEGAGPAEWENTTLDRFLEALMAFSSARVTVRAIKTSLRGGCSPR
jgi:hypothetical protein